MKRNKLLKLFQTSLKTGVTNVTAVTFNTGAAFRVTPGRFGGVT